MIIHGCVVPAYLERQAEVALAHDEELRSSWKSRCAGAERAWKPWRALMRALIVAAGIAGAALGVYWSFYSKTPMTTMIGVPVMIASYCAMVLVIISWSDLLPARLPQAPRYTADDLVRASSVCLVKLSSEEIRAVHAYDPTVPAEVLFTASRWLVEAQTARTRAHTDAVSGRMLTTLNTEAANLREQALRLLEDSAAGSAGSVATAQPADA